MSNLPENTIMQKQQLKVLKLTNQIYTAVLFGVSLIIFVAATIHSVIPNLFWTYNVRQALMLMDSALIWSSVQPGDALPKQKRPEANTLLPNALTYLMEAMYWQPYNSRSYYLAGHIYAVQDKWQQAAESFVHAYILSPEALLPGWSASLVDEQKDAQLIGQESFYAAIGFSTEQLLLLRDADRKLLRGQYDVASQNYKLSRLMRQGRLIDHPVDLLFRQVIASAMSGDSDVGALIAALRRRDKEFTVPIVASTLQLSGSQFRWMTPVDPPTVTFGTSLSYPYISKTKTGIFWWAGQAGVLVSVLQSDDYQLYFKLRHSEPSPVEMVVGVDGKRLYGVTLARGDNSWEIKSIKVQWSKGFHTINLWFLNNGGYKGKDRDAAIEWVMITPHLQY